MIIVILNWLDFFYSLSKNQVSKSWS